MKDLKVLKNVEKNNVIPTEELADNVNKAVWAIQSNFDCDAEDLSGGIS